jgi:hypothetical protein
MKNVMNLHIPECLKDCINQAFGSGNPTSPAKIKSSGPSGNVMPWNLNAQKYNDVNVWFDKESYQIP